MSKNSKVVISSVLKIYHENLLSSIPPPHNPTTPVTISR